MSTFKRKCHITDKAISNLRRHRVKLIYSINRLKRTALYKNKKQALIAKVISDTSYVLYNLNVEKKEEVQIYSDKIAKLKDLLIENTNDDTVIESLCNSMKTKIIDLNKLLVDDDLSEFMQFGQTCSFCFNYIMGDETTAVDPNNQYHTVHDRCII
jgi:hypothetical protein